MSLLVFIHAQPEGPCELGKTLRDHGHRLRFVNLHRNEKIPPDLNDVDGIVSMGGPMNVAETAQYSWISHELTYLKTAHQVGKPIVGVCLGAQMIAAALGGEVQAMPQAEVGWHPVRLGFPGATDPIFAGVGWNTVQFHCHGQEVVKLPPDAVPLAGSKLCKNQAFRVGLRTYAFQHHFEWNRQDLEVVLHDPFIPQVGGVPADIRQQADTYYDDYRRLGDRVCANLAELLFPIDKV